MNSSSKSPSLGTLWAQITTQWHRHKKLKCMWETENLLQLLITPFPTSLCFYNIQKAGNRDTTIRQKMNETFTGLNPFLFHPGQTILITTLLQNPNSSSAASHLVACCPQFIFLMPGGKRGLHHTEMTLVYFRAKKSPSKNLSHLIVLFSCARAMCSSNPRCCRRSTADPRVTGQLETADYTHPFDSLLETFHVQHRPEAI